MTGLCLLISLLWVFPSVCWALNIPIESALLVGGEPVGFSVHPQRHKRSEKADCLSRDQYIPRGKNHCCSKCNPGSKVAKDCEGPSHATVCSPCETGYFMNVSSSTKKCKECSFCLPQLGQVELSNCTRENDVVCGCPDGHFKKVTGKIFKCVECSKCNNGRELHRCYDDKDTFCHCFHGFFLHEETKKCHNCTECNNANCQEHCPPPPVPLVPSVKPKEDNVAIIVAGVSCAVAVLVAMAYITWMKRERITSYLQNKTCPPEQVLEGTVQSVPLMESNESMPTSMQQPLPGYTPCARDNPYVVQQNAQNSSTVVLPDVTLQTLQTTAPSLLKPNDLYKIIKCIPVSRWLEFVRFLGLDAYTIETTERDYKHFHEAQYKMLDIWINRIGPSGATKDCLLNVLREMDLGGCAEAVEMSLRQ